MNAVLNGRRRVLYALPLLLVVACQRGADRAQPATAAYEIQNGPIAIAASTVGRFADGHSWQLSVNSSGHAELTIDTFSEKTHRQFQVSEEQMQALRKLLLTERFFDLKSHYGERVPDGSTRTITVTAGDQSKSVKLFFLMNWVNDEDAEVRKRLREPARAIRILSLIRSWFSDSEAVDLGRYDRMVIEAVESIE